LFFALVGAVERLVDGLDLGECRVLAVGEVLGGFDRGGQRAGLI
jgi:hypothetical protein